MLLFILLTSLLCFHYKILNQNITVQKIRAYRNIKLCKIILTSLLLPVFVGTDLWNNSHQGQGSRHELVIREVLSNLLTKKSKQSKVKYKHYPFFPHFDCMDNTWKPHKSTDGEVWLRLPFREQSEVYGDVKHRALPS